MYVLSLVYKILKNMQILVAFVIENLKKTYLKVIYIFFKFKLKNIVFIVKV